MEEKKKVETNNTARTLAGLALFTGLGFASAWAYEIFCPRATFWGRVLTHGPRTVSAVGLLFDQSPNESTKDITRTLLELECPATFFIEGRRAKENPRGLRMLHSFDIGVHGDTYRPLAFKNELTIRRRLRMARNMAKEAQGRAPRFLLPPKGWKDLSLIRTAEKMGLKVVNPAIRIRQGNSGAYTDDPVEATLERVLPGDTILIPKGTSTDILQPLINGLRELQLEPWGLRALFDQPLTRRAMS